jgi:hypothetical protein
MYFKAKFFDGFGLEANVPRRLGAFELESIENTADAEDGTKYTYQSQSDTVISAYVYKNLNQPIPAGIDNESIKNELEMAFHGVLQVAPHLGWEDIAVLEPAPQVLAKSDTDPHMYLWCVFVCKTQKMGQIVPLYSHLLLRGSAGYFNKIRCTHNTENDTKKMADLANFSALWSAALEQYETKNSRA